VASGDAAKWAKMQRFAQMVWKNTSKVGFGVKGDRVIAWYCDARGNQGGAEDYKANIGALCE